MTQRVDDLHDLSLCRPGGPIADGFDALDRGLAGGFRPGHVLVGGSPGVGKRMSGLRSASSGHAGEPDRHSGIAVPTRPTEPERFKRFDVRLACDGSRVEMAAAPCATLPGVIPKIVPSVLPADFARLGDDCAALEEAGVDRIQWDVMDGKFVPNLTFGPDVIAACRPHASVMFEAHLMVVEPDELMGRYVDAGCSLLLVHAESTRHLHRSLGRVREL